MKKIIAFFILITSVIVLASCGKDPKISIDVVETSNSLSITMDCKNTRDVEKGTINIYIYKDYGKTGQKLIKARGCSGYHDTVIFEELDPTTTYDLRVTCTFKDELGYEVLVNQYTTSDIQVSNISNVEQFKAISNDLSKTSFYTLANDIDFEGGEIEPLGTTKFYGVLDGQGHTIKNLTINSSSQNIGLFSKLSGTVKNLTIENLTINATYKLSATLLVGAIAGYSNGLIENVTVKNVTINLTDSYTSSAADRTFIGGLVGEQAASKQTADIESKVINNSVNGKIEVNAVNACANVGGLIGNTTHAAQGEYITVENCKTDVAITTNNKYETKIGGLFSVLDNRVELKNCYAKSTINVTNDTTINRYQLSIGGIAGKATAPKATNVVADTNVTLKTDSKTSIVEVGGIFGFASGSIELTNSVSDMTANLTTPDAITDLQVGKLIASALSPYKLVDKVYANTTATKNTVNYEIVDGEEIINASNYTDASSIMTELAFNDLWTVTNGKIMLK